MKTNTDILERGPEPPLRWERQLELLTSVYRDAGLAYPAAQKAAVADLASLYDSPRLVE